MYFKSYSQYVSHYQVIVQILAQRKQDTELQQIFESLKPQALGKGLKDYMIMPVQRIPRYALLLHVRSPPVALLLCSEPNTCLGHASPHVASPP